MIDLADSIVERWAVWIGSSAWQLALFVILIAVLARWVADTQPRLRHALWVLVIVKAFASPALASPIGVGQLLTWDPLQAVISAGDVVVAGQPAGALVDTATSSESSQSIETPLVVIGLVIWGVGCLAYWTIAAVSHCRALRRTASCVSMEEGPERVLLEQLSMEMGLRRTPELRVSPEIESPYLIGLVNAQVVLPSTWLESASREDLEAVLAHELMHFRRGDLWISVLQVLVLGIHWFHPMAWWSMTQLQQAREEACDSSVLSMQSIHPERYADAMLRTVMIVRAKPAATRGLVGVFERGGQLQRRLEKVMNHNAMVSGLGWRGVGLLITITLTLMPMSPWSRGTATADQVAMEQGPDAKPTLEVQVVQGPPRISRTVPEVGAIRVSPTLTSIRVTFDRDMSTGMSWTGGGPEFPPVDQTRKANWIDPRTCQLPVKLERGMFYRVGINSTSFQNFKSVQGTPAKPSTIYFATKGASPDVIAKARKPEIERIRPANGTANVDPSIKVISVTFNMPMAAGMSWTGGGASFPTIPQGQRPSWSKDQRTCRLPVQLQAGKTYRLGFNSLSHKNFQSAAGIPLEPVTYEIHTRKGTADP